MGNLCINNTNILEQNIIDYNMNDIKADNIYNIDDNIYLYDIGLKYYTDKKYDLAKKYYLMAIAKGNTDAMNNLGFYYIDIEDNSYLIKKYLFMAIQKGNTSAMNNLGLYYETREMNYKLMKNII